MNAPINPNWITAGIALVGFVFNAGWSWGNLRMERRLRLWVEANFVRRHPPQPMPRRHSRPEGDAA